LNEIALTVRELRKLVLSLLESSDLDDALIQLSKLPSRRVINPLFSFLLHANEKVRWRAINAMGVVVDNMARTDMESARIIMRRLMWSLNDESGGIGWGAPEAMGEIMARNERLADEFCTILLSYLDENGNFLEYEVLQRGLLWGLIRLAQARPALVVEAGSHLPKYLESEDSVVRGLSAWAAGILGVQGAASRLQELAEDPALTRLYIDDEFVERSVAELAQLGLEQLLSNTHS
jgi:HEAT repeat protein